MSQVPEGLLDISPPFTVTALDLFGPYSVRGMGGGSRKQMKAWGTVFMCLRTKSACILACPGYDTTSFMTTYQRFTSIYGHPALVISDQGTQLKSAAKQLGQDGVDWQRVFSLTASSGTRWHLTPRECPWRNGSAERAVGMAKTTLKRQLDGHLSLDVLQIDALFLKVASILNSRPIGVRFVNDDTYHPISPNDLLLGRSAGPRRQEEVEEKQSEVDPNATLTAQDALCERWWQEWNKLAFQLLVPRQKWHTQHRNMAVGDIVMLRYDGKVSKDKYRLARVQEIHPDSKGVVRTVTIGLRPRHAKEGALPYRHKPLTEFVVGIQRLIVILPQEEQAVSGADQDQELPPHEDPEVASQHPLDEDISLPKEKKTQRRSRRLQHLDPERYMCNAAQGKTPRPPISAEINSQIPTSLLCLYQGGVPHIVPAWLPDILEQKYEQVPEQTGLMRDGVEQY